MQTGFGRNFCLFLGQVRRILRCGRKNLSMIVLDMLSPVNSKPVWSRKYVRNGIESSLSCWQHGFHSYLQTGQE